MTERMTSGRLSGAHANPRSPGSLTGRNRLRAWLDDVQLSNRMGSSHYANPGELKADLRTLLDELDALAGALEECARVSGADVSGGVPTWPPLHVWAVEEVRELRAGYDEAIGEGLRGE